jgi:hypothetical protein
MSWVSGGLLLQGALRAPPNAAKTLGVYVGFTGVALRGDSITFSEVIVRS